MCSSSCQIFNKGTKQANEAAIAFAETRRCLYSSQSQMRTAARRPKTPAVCERTRRAFRLGMATRLGYQTTSIQCPCLPCSGSSSLLQSRWDGIMRDVYAWGRFRKHVEQVVRAGATDEIPEIGRLVQIGDGTMHHGKAKKHMRWFSDSPCQFAKEPQKGKRRTRAFAERGIDVCASHLLGLSGHFVETRARQASHPARVWRGGESAWQFRKHFGEESVIERKVMRQNVRPFPLHTHDCVGTSRARVLIAFQNAKADERRLHQMYLESMQHTDPHLEVGNLRQRGVVQAYRVVASATYEYTRVAKHIAEKEEVTEPFGARPVSYSKRIAIKRRFIGQRVSITVNERGITKNGTDVRVGVEERDLLLQLARQKKIVGVQDCNVFSV